jgi:hypothetical protein
MCREKCGKYCLNIVFTPIILSSDIGRQSRSLKNVVAEWNTLLVAQVKDFDAQCRQVQRWDDEFAHGWAEFKQLQSDAKRVALTVCFGWGVCFRDTIVGK